MIEYDNQYAPFPGRLLRAMVSADLPGECFRVALALLLHCSPDKPECNPGQRTIARLSGVHLRNVPRAIDRLEDAGVLTVEPGIGKRTTTYRFTVWRDETERAKPRPTRQSDPAPASEDIDPRILQKLEAAGVKGKKLGQAAANPELSLFTVGQLIEQAESDASIKSKAAWIAAACINYTADQGGGDSTDVPEGILTDRDEIEARIKEVYGIKEEQSDG